MDVDEPEDDDVEYVPSIRWRGPVYAAWHEVGRGAKTYEMSRIRYWGEDAYAKEGEGVGDGEDEIEEITEHEYDVLRRRAQERNTMPTVEEEIKPLYDACYALFCRKQADYGSGNIEAFGDVGVLVRLSDKLVRLKHLLAQGASPNNEAIEDTWQDIANYGVIGLALARGVGFHPPERYRLLRRMDDVEARK